MALIDFIARHVESTYPEEGCGLVFDEFALFWNLNPEYAQTLSLYSAAIALVMLANLTWFREFWVAVGRRAWYRAGGGR